MESQAQAVFGDREITVNIVVLVALRISVSARHGQISPASRLARAVRRGDARTMCIIITPSM
jgi:hypothetical protein